jgi:prophage DNA circulation protein
LNLNFSIAALASKPTSQIGDAGTTVASNSGAVTQPVVKPDGEQPQQAVAPLSVLAESVAPTAAQQAVFKNDPTLQNTQITQENAASTAVLFMSAIGSNADFFKALSPEGNKLTEAVDSKKNTVAELLDALDKAIDASPNSAATLTQFKASIAKLLAANKASTATSADAPQAPVVETPTLPIAT